MGSSLLQFDEEKLKRRKWQKKLLCWKDATTSIFIEAVEDKSQVSSENAEFKSQSQNNKILCVNIGATSEFVKQGVNEETKAQLQRKRLGQVLEKSPRSQGVLQTDAPIL